MSEDGAHVIEKVVQTIPCFLRDRDVREGLEAERLVRKQKAKQRTFVLTEPSEEADENGKDHRMEGIELRHLLNGHPAKPSRAACHAHEPLGFRHYRRGQGCRADTQRMSRKGRAMHQRLVEYNLFK